MSSIRHHAYEGQALGLAAEALGSTVHNDDVCALLLGLVDHHDNFVRMCSIYGLADFSEEPYVRFMLTRRVECDSSDDVRGAAHEVLVWSKDPSSAFVPTRML
jgi:hypothetical protein